MFPNRQGRPRICKTKSMPTNTTRPWKDGKKYSTPSLFFFFFLATPTAMQKFLGQGSNLCHAVTQATAVTILDVQPLGHQRTPRNTVLLNQFFIPFLNVLRNPQWIHMWKRDLLKPINCPWLGFRGIENYDFLVFFKIQQPMRFSQNEFLILIFR